MTTLMSAYLSMMLNLNYLWKEYQRPTWGGLTCLVTCHTMNSGLDIMGNMIQTLSINCLKSLDFMKTPGLM
jgi:hypothetical protein